MSQLVGVQPQAAQTFPRTTLKELFTLWSSLYEDALAPNEMLDLLELDKYARHYVSQLSGGEQQRVLVGLALISQPRLAVLDEPTSGMDPNSRALLWNIIDTFKNRGTTFLVSTHIMEEAQRYCDNIYIIDHGKVVIQGTYSEFVNQYATQNKISLQVLNEQEMSHLKSLNYVQELTFSRQANYVRVSAVTTDVSRFMKEALAGVVYSHLRVDEYSLEDIFRTATNPADTSTGQLIEEERMKC